MALTEEQRAKLRAKAEEQRLKNETQTTQENDSMMDKKYCKHCGQLIDVDCIICPACGKQVEQLTQFNQPNIVINNDNTNTNTNTNMMVGGFGRPKNKWVAFVLCLFLGFFGAHKFYEGKVGMGILYLFTFGLGGIGWFIDLIIILCKPNPYFVYTY